MVSCAPVFNRRFAVCLQSYKRVDNPLQVGNLPHNGNFDPRKAFGTSHALSRVGVVTLGGQVTAGGNKSEAGMSREICRGAHVMLDMRRVVNELHDRRGE